MNIVPVEQIVGGKFCAALERKLVRDLFDIQSIYHELPINEAMKEGFLYSLLSSSNSILSHFSIPIEHRQNPTRTEVAGIIDQPLTEYESNDISKFINSYSYLVECSG